jgi:hypothetical protein
MANNARSMPQLLRACVVACLGLICLTAYTQGVDPDAAGGRQRLRQPTQHDEAADGNKSPPLVCVVVRTYWAHGSYGDSSLPHLIKALQAQTHAKCVRACAFEQEGRAAAAAAAAAAATTSAPHTKTRQNNQSTQHTHTINNKTAGMRCCW